jgi:hypothetical protein
MCAKAAISFVALFSIAFAITGFASAGSRAAPRVRMLVSTRKPVAAFAQNGHEVAWGVERSSGCKAAVHIRSLSSGRERIVTAPRCFDYPFYEPALAVAGGNVLWQAGDAVSHWGDDTTLLVAGPSATRAHRLALVQQQWGGGQWVTSIVNDKATIAWGYLDSACNMNESDCEETYPITGAVFRLVRGARKAVPQSGPTLDIAVSGDRLALLPARDSGDVEDEWSIPPADGPLVVRSLTSGDLIVEIPPSDGTFREVALSTHTVAVLVKRSDGHYVDRYRVPGGELIDSTAVAANASDLSLAGADAVFRSGRKIELIKAGSTTAVTLAVAAGEPIGLSVSGRRIAWAENLSRGGRIVALSP